MARTNDSLVEGIIKVNSTISLTPFITIANLMVTQCCTDLPEDYSDDQLEQIETWLSAHFYTVRDMRAERERAATVEEKFQSKVDLGFNTSHYGQMAMRIDFHGGLAALDKQTLNGIVKTVGLNYLGTTKEEAEALVD
jgi:hypothetical protein